MTGLFCPAYSVFVAPSRWQALGKYLLKWQHLPNCHLYKQELESRTRKPRGKWRQPFLRHQGHRASLWFSWPFPLATGWLLHLAHHRWRQERAGERGFADVCSHLIGQHYVTWPVLTTREERGQPWKSAEGDRKQARWGCVMLPTFHHPALPLCRFVAAGISSCTRETEHSPYWFI